MATSRDMGGIKLPTELLNDLRSALVPLVPASYVTRGQLDGLKLYHIRADGS